LTPVIRSVVTDSYDGPVVDTTTAGPHTLTITSVGNVNGNVDVPDPNFPQTETSNAVMITRNYGFGSIEGEVWIGDLQIDPADVTWGLTTITATVPAVAETGQLTIVRGDSGRSTVNAVTVIMASATDLVTQVTASIQAVIDSAVDGEIIVIPPGTYFEPLIITKPVQLAGAGAGSLTSRGRGGGVCSARGRARHQVNRAATTPSMPRRKCAQLSARPGTTPAWKKRSAAATAPTTTRCTMVPSAMFAPR